MRTFAILLLLLLCSVSFADVTVTQRVKPYGLHECEIRVPGIQFAFMGWGMNQEVATENTMNGYVRWLKLWGNQGSSKQLTER